MATRNTQYVIRVGSQNKAGDGYSYLSKLCKGDWHPYGFAGKPSQALRFVGRQAAEEAAMWLATEMGNRGHYPPVRLVPARGGMETSFRPERVA